MRAPTGCAQIAKPKMTEQEKALLEFGFSHTALMSVSIITTLVYIYLTEFDGHVVPLGVFFALLAAWASAVIEAQMRVQTGDPIGETQCPSRGDSPSKRSVPLAHENAACCARAVQVLMETVASAIFGGFWLIFTLIIIKMGNELTDGRHTDPDS